MKHIVYINNYFPDDIIDVRNNEKFFSQPANNKIQNLVRALECADIKTTVLSSALTSNGKRWYPAIYGNKISNSNIIYCGVLGLPLINSFTSAFSIYRTIKCIHRKETINRIVFYNFKPEAAWPAFWANKHLGIPITVEFEDGYRQIEELSSLKKKIFSYTEHKVKSKVDRAIVANALMKSEFSVPAYVLRGIVNTEFYNLCNSYKKTSNEYFTVLYSGGLDRSRGIQVLIESLKYLEIPCRILVTGKGKIQSSDSRIEHLGFLTYEQMLQIMMQADLLVQCQLVNDRFANVSFPSKLFEYIATGNHIVSSSLPDVKAFAGDHFFYYENDDPVELAVQIFNVYQLWKAGEEKDHKVMELCKHNMPEEIGKTISSFLFQG